MKRKFRGPPFDAQCAVGSQHGDERIGHLYDWRRDDRQFCLAWPVELGLFRARLPPRNWRIKSASRDDEPPAPMEAMAERHKPKRSTASLDQDGKHAPAPFRTYVRSSVLSGVGNGAPLRTKLRTPILLKFLYDFLPWPATAAALARLSRPWRSARAIARRPRPRPWSDRPENFVVSRGMGVSPGEESSPAGVAAQTIEAPPASGQIKPKEMPGSARHDRGLGDILASLGPFQGRGGGASRSDHVRRLQSDLPLGPEIRSSAFAARVAQRPVAPGTTISAEAPASKAIPFASSKPLMTPATLRSLRRPS